MASVPQIPDARGKIAVAVRQKYFYPPKKNSKLKPRAKQARVVTPVDGQVAGLDADDDVVAFFEEVRRAAPHTPANFARLDFILTQDHLAALRNVPKGLVEACEAAVKIVEVDHSDDEVEEVGNPQPQATKQVRVEAGVLKGLCKEGHLNDQVRAMGDLKVRDDAGWDHDVLGFLIADSKADVALSGCKKFTCKKNFPFCCCFGKNRAESLQAFGTKKMVLHLFGGGWGRHFLTLLPPRRPLDFGLHGVHCNTSNALTELCKALKKNERMSHAAAVRWVQEKTAPYRIMSHCVNENEAYTPPSGPIPLGAKCNPSLGCQRWLECFCRCTRCRRFASS